jgi:hypothetical protein
VPDQAESSFKNDPSPDPHAPEIGAGDLIPVPIH